MSYKVMVKKGEDGWYVVNCPSLKGCWSQGKTVDEALENIKDAIASYLDVLNEITEKEKADILGEYEVTVNA